MKGIVTKCSILACGAVLTTPRASRADDPSNVTSLAWHDSRLASDIGVSAMLGGGVIGFTEKTMRDLTTSAVGGLWDLRVTLGSHTPLGLDIGYVGSAANINTLTGAHTGTLVGTTVEGAVRFNVLPHDTWNPYGFVGMGWQRYDVTGGTIRLSDSGMNETDNSIVFPMGVGIAYRDRSGLVLDLRGTFRSNIGYGLVLESGTSATYVPMHTWEASAAAGYEF